MILWTTKLDCSCRHSPQRFAPCGYYLPSDLTSTLRCFLTMFLNFNIWKNCMRYIRFGSAVRRSFIVKSPAETLNSGWNLGEQLPGMSEAALYVHWPYCERRCTYCNFNKYIARAVDQEAMRYVMTKETETLIQLSELKCVTSVFFGGGTPSLAEPQTIAAILDTIAKWAHIPYNAEITLEANPTSSTISRLTEFKNAGVNRLSIGLQSIQDKDLKILGRNHTANEALHMLAEAKKLFPGHSSVDVIFGRSGQTLELWEKELQELLQLCDNHVSLYQLTLERGTQLYKQNAVSHHNINYWQGGQYIGVGPGAHGRFSLRKDGKMQREARIQTLEPDIWMKEVLQFGHGTRKRVAQNKLDILEEALVLGLRMTNGISHQHWQKMSPTVGLQEVFSMCPEFKDLTEQGFLILDQRGLRCSWKGLALLDSILPTLLIQLQVSFTDSV
ncbi:radical S-adenosyl methionine domain-containing protein 1, mitochondrial isoform X3 [Protopterus annectens]|uniref:radical S-adenosyl methionine domain-containing protein 1, mitochondrial isoform X3 n=1 Tax=Protopterus annectens TaxID=7888 RepID=UPI001CFC2944|nr:radical S-adenosyl methionine domain-containing protein 1, mitochondrial isoform X3 [Protopterus annectens]